MLIDFNDKKFTIISILFLLFCIYQSGYMSRKPAPAPNYQSQENRNYVNQAQYKIKIDPSKPTEQMTLWEKGILYFLKNNDNILPEIVSAHGDRFLIRYSEIINSQIVVHNRELSVVLGEKKIPDYIEGVLYTMEQGQTKQYEVKDKGTGVIKNVTVEVIEKNIKGNK